MLLVGLTGGIGAGKSTVARMLADRGAVIIDADDLARRAVDPGTKGFRAVVEAFGPRVVKPDGSLDRTRLAEMVFADEDARRRLESIIHPEVARLFADEAARYRDGDSVVVYVVPLLAENRLEGMFDVVVVVRTSMEERVARLAKAREMSANDIRGRMDAQLPDEQRERFADLVIRNDGSMQDLEREVDRLWGELIDSSR